MDTNKRLFPALALTAAIFSGLSTTPHASDLSYNFVEAGYLVSSSDDEVELDDTYSIEGTYKITDQFFINSGFSSGTGTAQERIEELNDDLKMDVDVSIFYVGAGYIHPLNDNWDANLIIGYSRSEMEGDITIRGFKVDLSDDDSGLFLRGGVRGMITPQIEVSAMLDYSNDDDSSDTDISLSGHYYFTDNISAGLSTEIDSDGTMFMAEARLYF
jgi:hypothetical protein